MCWIKITHHVAHDVRPLIATKLEGGGIFTNPYAEPRECDPAVCPGRIQPEKGKRRATNSLASYTTWDGHLCT